MGRQFPALLRQIQTPLMTSAASQLPLMLSCHHFVYLLLSSFLFSLAHKIPRPFFTFLSYLLKLFFSPGPVLFPLLFCSFLSIVLCRSGSTFFQDSCVVSNPTHWLSCTEAKGNAAFHIPTIVSISYRFINSTSWCLHYPVFYNMPVFVFLRFLGGGRAGRGRFIYLGKPLFSFFPSEGRGIPDLGLKNWALGF
jgi:hypothetical protein